LSGFCSLNPFVVIAKGLGYRSPKGERVYRENLAYVVFGSWGTLDQTMFSPLPRLEIIATAAFATIGRNL